MFSCFYSFPDMFLTPDRHQADIFHVVVTILRGDAGFTTRIAEISAGSLMETMNLCQILFAIILGSHTGPSRGKFSLLKHLCEHIFSTNYSSQGLVV